MKTTYQDVEVCVNNKPIRKFAYQGKTFIEARAGQEYSIKLKNNFARRILAIVTVDGINVVDGQAGGSSKMGYVLHGYSSFEIKGFRISNESVNAFKFNKKDKSYAAKSDVTEGDTSNCGIIGIQFVEEKETPRPQVVYRDRIKILAHPVPYPVPVTTPWRQPDIIWGTSTTPSFDTMRSVTTSSTRGCNGGGCSASSFDHSVMNFCATAGAPLGSLVDVRESPTTDSVTADWDMGTEFSKTEIESKVKEVEFELGRELETISIYYASRDALIGMGVPIEKEVSIPKFPQAFPSKFCKPPKS